MLFSKYDWDDELKKNAMDGACSWPARNANAYLKRRDGLDDVGIDGEMDLIEILWGEV